MNREPSFARRTGEGARPHTNLPTQAVATQTSIPRFGYARFREWVHSRAAGSRTSRTTVTRASFTILCRTSKNSLPASVQLRWGSPINARKAKNYFGGSDRVHRSARLGGRRRQWFEGGEDCSFDQAAGYRVCGAGDDHAGAHSLARPLFIARSAGRARDGAARG